jgi:hypothetical protein
MTTNSIHDIQLCSDTHDYILQNTEYNLKHMCQHCHTYCTKAEFNLHKSLCHQVLLTVIEYGPALVYSLFCRDGKFDRDKVEIYGNCCVMLTN